jgi:AbrB family looped-hinge helix DNA binding protein
VQTSRISAKGQVTLPRRVRAALGVGPGDVVAYEVEGGSVRVKKLEPFDAEFHAAVSKTLDEWGSDEDEQAFRDL